jgi:hypothetical protein
MQPKLGRPTVAHVRGLAVTNRSSSRLSQASSLTANNRPHLIIRLMTSIAGRLTYREHIREASALRTKASTNIVTGSRCFIDIYNMRFLPMIPLAFCISEALAQNSTSANNTSCDETFDLKGPLNASALVEVTSEGTPPWYLSVTFGDKRNSSSPDQSIYGFLSTPANSTAHACMRLFHKVLPATGTGSNGDCAGVLSNNCIDFLRRTLALTQSDVSNKNCPNAPSAQDMEKACPPLADTSGSTHSPHTASFLHTTLCIQHMTPQY